MILKDYREAAKRGKEAVAEFKRNFPEKDGLYRSYYRIVEERHSKTEKGKQRKKKKYKLMCDRAQYINKYVNKYPLEFDRATNYALVKDQLDKINAIRKKMGKGPLSGDQLNKKAKKQGGDTAYKNDPDISDSEASSDSNEEVASRLNVMEMQLPERLRRDTPTGQDGPGPRENDHLLTARMMLARMMADYSLSSFGPGERTGRMTAAEVAANLRSPTQGAIDEQITAGITRFEEQAREREHNSVLSPEDNNWWMSVINMPLPSFSEMMEEDE